MIDVMSPDGFNIGGGTRWMREAAEHAAPHVLPDGRTVRVVTPPYFVLLKLAAFLDRGPDPISAKDMEDLVFMAVEVDDLSEQVHRAGISSAVQAQWREVFVQHSIDVAYLSELVEYHLHPEDSGRRDRAVATLAALATGTVAVP